MKLFQHEGTFNRPHSYESHAHYISGKKTPSALWLKIIKKLAQLQFMKECTFNKIMSRELLVSLALICLFMHMPLRSQPSFHSESEIGLPLIRNYTPKEYGAGPQNLGITQDSRGIIYTANYNAHSILEYDGVTWRRTEMSSEFAPVSLAVDEHDRVYVGSVGDFGMLTPDSIGTLHFQSLLRYAKLEDREFLGVEATHVTASGVYFQSFARLFRWQSGTLKAWKARTSFSKSFLVQGDLYVYQNHVGLMKVVGDSLQIAAGGEQFANLPVMAMLPFPMVAEDNRDQALIGSDGQGLFLYNGLTLQPFRCAASDLVRTNGIRCSAILNDSTFAIASIDQGVVIFDANGKTVQIVDESAGLASNIVYEIIPDRGDGIWMATLQGVSRVSGIRPAMTVFDKRLGVEGVVVKSPVRHHGVLYLRTTRGVYYLDHRQSKFIPVTGLEGDLWLLFENGGSLYAIRESLKRISGSSATFVKPLEARASAVWPSLLDSNRVYFATVDIGLRALLNKRGSWEVGPRIGDFFPRIWSITEENNGDLWLGPKGSGVIRLRVANPEHLSQSRYFGTEDGTPSDQLIVVRTSVGVKFIGNSGIYCLDVEKQRVVPDTSLGSLLANGTRGVEYLAEDDKGNLWLAVVEGTNYYLNVSRRQPNGVFIYERKPFLDVPSAGIWTVFPDANGIVWFGGEEGLFRYDDNMRRSKAADFPALIRRIIVNEDSLIYNGGSTAAPRVELTYAQNNLRFECAATSFELPAANRFQFFLEGFEEDWSNWAGESHKDYTNIPEGTYTFRVRAKNVYEHLSREASFAFEILPPWWRTWWAYALYAFFLVFTLYFLRRYEQNRQQLKHEVELQRVEHEKLQEVDALKSRFFANISHEFRTPLTLILGQIESLLAKDPNAEDKDKLHMAFRNAKQLLRLINQLLDLSKIEAGRMALNAVPGNIVPLLRSLTASFESLATQKNLDLRFECAHDSIVVNFESEKIEKIMYNLLSNAMKFTPEGGKVSVQLSVTSRSEAEIPAARDDQFPVTNNNQLITDNCLLITIRDSGIGIPQDRLAYVFDRFYQINASRTREHEGTGIGLALTKELVELHGGTISAESAEGFGSTFAVKLPVISAQLSVTSDQSLIPDFEHPAASIESERSGDPAFAGQPATSDQQSKTPLIHQSIAPTAFILIIEDNADVRSFIREHLQDTYRVIEAADGEDGFIKAQEYIPDLIISDVMMPKLDGYELARRIRAHELTSHIPTIMLTAKAAEEEKLEGLETGVDAYLIKPFSIKELQVRVRKLIEMRRKLRAQLQHRPVVKASEVAVTPVDQKFLERLQKIAEENMAEEDFQVEELCKQVGMSQRQLHRKLGALLDHSPKSYLRQLRLDRAKQLLEKNAGTVSEIAFEVGYGNVSAFSRAFREVFGNSPSELLKKE